MSTAHSRPDQGSLSHAGDGTSSLALAVIGVFNALYEALPPPIRYRASLILHDTVASGAIKDADALRLLGCLVEPKRKRVAPTPTPCSPQRSRRQRADMQRSSPSGTKTMPVCSFRAE